MALIEISEIVLLTQIDDIPNCDSCDEHLPAVNETWPAGTYTIWLSCSTAMFNET